RDTDKRAARRGGGPGGRVGGRGQGDLPLELVVGGDRAGLVHRHRDRVGRVRRRGDVAGPVAEVVAAAGAVGDVLVSGQGDRGARIEPVAVAGAADVAGADRGRVGRERELLLELVVGGDRAGLVHRHRDRVVRVRRRGDVAGPVAEVVAAAGAVGDVLGRREAEHGAVVVVGAVRAAAEVAERDRRGAGRRVGRRRQRELPLELVVGGDRG